MVTQKFIQIHQPLIKPTYLLFKKPTINQTRDKFAANKKHMNYKKLRIFYDTFFLKEKIYLFYHFSP